MPPPPPPTDERGVHGFFLGGCAFLIILLIAALLGTLVALEEDTGDELKEQIENVAATEVARIDTLPVEDDGTVTVTEEHLTTELRRYTADYGPLDDPEVEIRPDVIRVSFDVFGLGNSYEAGVEVNNGEIQLVNVEGSRVADTILPAEDVADIVEDTLRDLQQRSNVVFTDVELRDGAMILTTQPADGTPVAGTPAPTPAAAGTATAVSTATASPRPSGSARPTTDLSSAATEAVGGTVESLPGDDDATSVATATATRRASGPTRTPTSTSTRGNLTFPTSTRTPTPTPESGIVISD